LAACAIILAGGVLVGFASGRSKAHAGQQQRAAGSQQQLNATQLPLPNSAAAQQLLADPLTPGGDVSYDTAAGGLVDTTSHASIAHALLIEI
jgi:hypothetical protein